MRYACQEQVHNLAPIRPFAVAQLRRFYMDATVFKLINRSEMRNDQRTVARRELTLRRARRVR